MKLINKRILILSPQKWDGLFVSKHHYAIELAKKGNQVYFLGPPDKNSSLELQPTAIENLFVVHHRLFFNRKLRFHLRWLFDFLIQKHIKLVIRCIGKVDIVWCFELNLYKNLNWFDASFKIFHPVDHLNEAWQYKIGKSADVIFSVADNILEKFNTLDTPKFFINHGLSESYCQPNTLDTSNSIRFAYIGNLMIVGLDRDRIKEIIINYPTVNFDFFGNYSTEIEDDFITFLTEQPNTFLKGRRSTQELAQLLKIYSGFILCYNPKVESNSGANSHKILEYLSFGKVIVANKIHHYEQHRDLIQMSNFDDNSDYVQLFKDTILNLEELNSEDLINQRRALAFDNSYKKQIERIEQIITEKYSNDS